MTNVFGTPDKVATKARLFQIGINALEKEGWNVERIPKIGKSSVRRIKRGSQTKIVTIRTTQNTDIAFPRNDEDTDWNTLDMVDAVVAVSVDNPDHPRFANVHFIDGDDMRDRFNRAYAARKKAGHSIPIGRGVWLGLYLPDGDETLYHVGAGAGLTYPPIAVMPLEVATSTHVEEERSEVAVEDGPLSIAEARRRLAKTFGIEPGNVKIIIES